MTRRQLLQSAKVILWLCLPAVFIDLHAQRISERTSLLETLADVTESNGYDYGLHDNRGNSMDALQVIEDDQRGYLGVYHTYKGGIFTANLARSLDLLDWRFQTAIGGARTAMPTIFRASNNGFVTAFEQSDEKGEIHLHFDYYESRQDLIGYAPTRSFDAPLTLSTTSTKAEGTPLIKSVLLDFSIDSSTIEVDFHYFDERNPAVDRQARGTLTNFDSWKTNKQEGLDASLEVLGTKGNIGDRDRLQLLGGNTLLIEGQLQPRKWETWRLFQLDESAGLRPWDVITHNGSSAFGNPSAELLVSPNGSLSLAIGTFLFGEGAARGEGGQLFFYREFGSKNFITEAFPNSDFEITASSNYSDGYSPKLAVDGDKSTRWASAARGQNEWLQVDFGAIQRFDTVEILWEVALAHLYTLSASRDGKNWTVIKEATRNGLSRTIDYFQPVNAAFLRLDCQKTSADLDLFSLWEIRVFSQDPDLNQNDLPDEWEGANDVSGASGDEDGDGLSNLQECRHGTNHRIQDSDSDGFDDLTELNHSSDPLDPLMSPEILSVHRAIQIDFGTQAGRSYILERSRDLKSWSSYVDTFSREGVLFSTPSDFTKVIKCVVNYGSFKGGRILEKETVELIMQNHVGDISLNPEGWHYDPAA